MATLYVRVFVSLICISSSAAAKSGYFLTVIALAAGRLEDSQGSRHGYFVCKSFRFIDLHQFFGCGKIGLLPYCNCTGSRPAGGLLS
jgi:hypothetical protein